MKPGTVLVDVAIDQGGCFETSRPTSHAEPTYVVDGVVHYCVTNMPGAVARTSTYALNNVILPHALRIASKGWKAALAEDPHLAEGLNIHARRVTYETVARELGYDYVPVRDLLRAWKSEWKPALARGRTLLIVALISTMFLGVYLQPTELAAMAMIGLGVILIALVGKTTVCKRTAAVLAHRTGSLIAANPSGGMVDFARAFSKSGG